jgi:hypothetical protein
MLKHFLTAGRLIAAASPIQIKRNYKPLHGESGARLAALSSHSWLRQRMAA